MKSASPAEPAAPVDPVLSRKALAAGRSGCAGVRFRIAADGLVKDAAVIVEDPPGFGFGASALAGLATTLYTPAQSKADWYYVDAVFVQQGATAAAAPLFSGELRAVGSLTEGYRPLGVH